MGHLLRIDVLIATDDQLEARELQEELVNQAAARPETLALHAHTPREWHRDFPEDPDA
jgi:hypothetical protein